MEKFPKVGIVYLAYYPQPYLDRFIDSINKIKYPFDRLSLIIVDNPHPEFGSAQNYLESRFAPLFGKNFPIVTILPQGHNLGVATGYNVGISAALSGGCSYVMVHNQDGFMAEDCLARLVDALEADSSLGCVQPLIMLYPETDLINTSGNAYHYLGFGYSDNYQRRFTEVNLAPIKDIGYASGAALLLRAETLREHGLFCEGLTSYHEDLEYSLRLKSRGLRVAAVRDAKFFHQYEFTRNPNKFYLMERNRWAVLLTYYRYWTLLLLAPVCLALEAGLIIFAFAGGWLGEKLSADAYWLRPSSWRYWLLQRRVQQAARTAGDRALLSDAVSEIIFEDKDFQSPLLRYVGNPILSAYWRLVKRLIV